MPHFSPNSSYFFWNTDFTDDTDFYGYGSATYLQNSPSLLYDYFLIKKNPFTPTKTCVLRWGKWSSSILLMVAVPQHSRTIWS